MRKALVLLVGALLCPTLATAQAARSHLPYSVDDLPSDFWLGAGFGGGSISSAAPAPSAARDAFGVSLDAGYRITRQWGVGFEFGLIAPNGGCGGHHCTPASPDFAPDFTHWFMVGEYRVPRSGMRVRAGFGLSSMCYRYYRSHESGWEQFLDAVFDEDNYDQDTTSWDCKSLQALGASVSIGYQWLLSDSHSSVGLQLRGEAANFASSDTAGTAAFRHRAVMLQIQLNIN